MNTSLNTLADWLAYLELLHPKSIEFGLDRLQPVKQVLGIHFSCPVITVGGTNGKGSTCAFLESIYQQTGYRTGLYSSPHLLHFNERARLNGAAVDDAALMRVFAEVEVARCAFNPPVSLTYFEFTTLAVLRLFQHAALDVVILEVGLGGRLDAVNCVDADCSIITSVALDHCDYLGDTREKIAWEKAHIYRTGKPAICADPQPPDTLIEYAQKIGADLRLFGRDFNYSGDKQQWAYGGRTKRYAGLAYPALRGANQLLNASGALAALEALHALLPVPSQAIRAGFAVVELPGRFQVLPGQPVVVLDVAHNPHAAAVLADNLDNMGFYPVTHAIFGCMADKDIAGLVQPLLDRIDHWHLTSLPTARAASAAQLAQYLPPGTAFTLHESPAQAWKSVQTSASQGDRIAAFGSFITVGQVMAQLDKTQAL